MKLNSFEDNGDTNEFVYTERQKRSDLDHLAFLSTYKSIVFGAKRDNLALAFSSWCCSL
jgi:hypothetical protein